MANTTAEKVKINQLTRPTPGQEIKAENYTKDFETLRQAINDTWTKVSQFLVHVVDSYYDLSAMDLTTMAEGAKVLVREDEKEQKQYTTYMLTLDNSVPRKKVWRLESAGLIQNSITLVEVDTIFDRDNIQNPEDGQEVLVLDAFLNFPQVYIYSKSIPGWILPDQAENEKIKEVLDKKTTNASVDIDKTPFPSTSGNGTLYIKEDLSVQTGRDNLLASGLQDSEIEFKVNGKHGVGIIKTNDGTTTHIEGILFSDGAIKNVHYEITSVEIKDITPVQQTPDNKEYLTTEYANSQYAPVAAPGTYPASNPLKVISKKRSARTGNILTLKADNVPQLKNGMKIEILTKDNTGLNPHFVNVPFYSSLTDNSAPFNELEFAGNHFQISCYRDYLDGKITFRMVGNAPFPDLEQELVQFRVIADINTQKLIQLEEELNSVSIDVDTNKGTLESIGTGQTPYADITPNATMTYNSSKNQFEHVFNTHPTAIGDRLDMIVNFAGRKTKFADVQVYADEAAAEAAINGHQNIITSSKTYQVNAWFEYDASGNGKFIIRGLTALDFDGTENLVMTYYIHKPVASLPGQTSPSTSTGTSGVEVIQGGFSYEPFWATGTQAYKQMHTTIDYTDFEACWDADKGKVTATIGVYGQGNVRISDVIGYQSWMTGDKTWGMNFGTQHNVLGSPPAAIAGVMQPYNNNGKLSFNTYIEVRPVTGHNTSRYIANGRVRLEKY